MILLKNCRLVPYLTEEYKGETADILIDGKTIVGIYPCGQETIENAEQIDLDGKTVLPGYFDLHAHLMCVNENWDYLMNRPQNTYLMDTAAYAKEYLKQGFTTIRDCGCDYYASVAVRDAINKGILTGTRVITSGKILTPTTRGNSSFGTLYEEVDGAEAMLKACRTEHAQGVDFIKYMATGSVLNLGGDPGQFISSPEELRAVVEAADSLGLYVAAHCHGTKGIKEAIKAGIRTIEHATYMDKECVELILKRGNTTSTIPTLAINFGILNDYSSPTLPEFKEKALAVTKSMVASLKMCMEAGVLVGFGTDLDLESASAHPCVEFIARSSFGIENKDILLQATINSAKIAGVSDKLGTVCVGKYADLVVIEGNPDEDMSCMQNYPYMVFKEGKRFVE